MTNITPLCDTATDNVHSRVNSPTRWGVDLAKGRVSIVVERCKACGFCVEFCPTKVLELSSAFNSKGYHPPHVVEPEKCSGCDLCGMYCPDFAIYGYKLPAQAKEAEGSKS